MVLIVGLANPAHAEKPSWSESDKMWGAIATSAMLSDYATTKDITKRYNEGYKEKFNPFLGTQPSEFDVDRYFLITGVLTYLIADNAGEYRKPFLKSVTALEVYCVHNNLRIGLKFSF